MKKNYYGKTKALRFKRFSNKSWSLFSCLGRVVIVGVLSIPTLAHAKASGISIQTALVGDTLNREEVKLDEVVVTGSRAPLTSLQTPKIIAVVTSDDIQRSEAETINDILKLISGVDVRQRGTFGVQTDISINGGTFDQIAILLNGVSISNPQTGHNATDFPLSLDDIERIEVLEGASSRLFGSSAFSGAVNIVTKKNIQTGKAVEGSARIEAGSFGTFMATTRISGETNDFHYAASIGATRSDGGTDNSDFLKRHVFAQSGLNKKAFLLYWQLGYSAQDYGANTFYSAKFNNQYEETQHLITSIAAEVPLANCNISIKPSVYYNWFGDHYQLIRDKEGAENGENYHTLHVYGGAMNADFNWLLGKTSIGVDVRKEDIRSTAYGDLLPENEWKDIKGSDRKYNKRGKRTNTSFFAEHNIILNHWTISAGLLANQNTALSGGLHFYPGLDISFRPSNAWKFFASWNKALRLPTYTDLYTSNAAQQGNINLLPEKNNTLKIGARRATTFSESTLSAFLSNGTDMIDWVYENENSTKYQALNIGKLKNIGFTFENVLHVNKIIRRCPINNIKLSYAFIHQDHTTEHEIYKSLYALEYLRHKVTIAIDHNIYKNLKASWAMRWQQRMNGYHPYFKIDGNLIWDANHYSIYLKADNITCHRYYDLGNVLQPGLWIMAGIKFEV